MEVRTPASLHLPKRVPAKNAPDFPYPNRDAPKTRLVLGANPCRRTFRGVCFCAPTRVHQKPARFYIPPPEYAKNAPHFTLPNKDTPKTCPVLYPNLRRRTFQGVCFCALHGCMKNLAGFGLCHTTWRETRQVLDFATRHSAKPGGF